jgi:SAM-dependent methyltransferase
MTKDYTVISNHYKSCLKKHGDTYKGLDWPNLQDMLLRYRIMLDVINTDQQVKLLDFGCGTGELYKFILDNKVSIDYEGYDINADAIQICKSKFPYVKFYLGDILKEDNLNEYDYIIANGVFTEKLELTSKQMWSFFKSVIKLLYKHSSKGLAFNVMSNHVDWKRADLFHCPHDSMAKFLTKDISRNFVIRNDYGLFEYTVYVYRN